MKIKKKIKLDFCDVLLEPQPSSTTSRKDVSLICSYSFKYSPLTWSGVPIISSNMTSVTTPKVAVAMVDHGMLACIPKSRTGSHAYAHHNLIQSIGLNDKPVGVFNWLCLDVPNAYIQAVVDRTKELRDLYPEVILIVGNVVTPIGVEKLILAGADIVKCGIGSGASCRTRIATGAGYPQLSAVIECSEAVRELGGHIISDGGCQTSGDVVKAFAAGASFVMLGGMLAGCVENGIDFYGSSSERGNNELNGITCSCCNGSGECLNYADGKRFFCEPCKGIGKIGGLKDYRTSEGWEMKVPSKGTIKMVLQDIEGGLRSACSYVGTRNLTELHEHAIFIRVNRQANTSLWDYRIK